ncbi:Homoserine kinase [Paenibacillus solanacearum]|uniref:Homoserine kinase n=1 Tax=Paenibacillus solanacearum TaxID=2048548 RepID=A0A916K6A2_9BACL|nr:phosphotransferase [Paenibacillus solanacearum]CAG7648034.1 Homoserine kinase [Paenibacillus solanacearum]
MGTTNEPTIFEAIAAQYDLGGPVEIRSELSGMNNTTRFVYAGTRKYVLRVYENHCDESKLRFEHGILERLQRLGLPFQTPRVLRTRGEADTFVTGPDGKLASLFYYIEGRRPDPGILKHVEGIGATSGALIEALAAVEMAEGLVGHQPYYLLQDNYPTAMDALRSIMEKPVPDRALQGLREEAEFLIGEVRSFQELIPQLSGLPHQLIHGDIVFDNALAEGDKIIGLLDFEFVTFDLRAMELAVITGELLQPGDSSVWETVQTLLSGYGNVHKLTREEAEALPALIKLRRLDVFLHFTERYVGGLDLADVLRSQLMKSAALCRWIGEHEERLRSMCRELLV